MDTVTVMVSSRFGETIGLLAVLLAAGCAIGPHYQRPQAEAPVEWKTTVDARHWKPAAPRDQEPHGAWWDVFNDPALASLERQAVEANQDLRQAMARVEQARAAARISGSELLPTVETNPSYEKFKRSSSSFGGSGTFEGETYTVPFDLSYEIDIWGRVRRSFEAARAEAAASLQAQRFVLLRVTSDVARQYFLLRQLDAEAEILVRTLELRRTSLQLAEARAEGGVVSVLDVARARTELSSAESDLLDVRRRRTEVENALAVLCGRNASTFSFDSTPLTADMLPPAIPPGLPSTLLERRPDIAEAERQLAAANARIGVAQAAFFPTLSLTGSAGYVSAELDSIFDNSSQVWSVAPSLSLPLFAGGRNMANLKATQAAHVEAFAVYRQRVLVAFADVESALANLQWLGRQAQAQADVVAAARKAAEISDHRYQQGLVNYLEAVDAERQRLQAERGAVQVLSNRLSSIVLLIKALGGSW